MFSEKWYRKLPLSGAGILSKTGFFVFLFDDSEGVFTRKFYKKSNNIKFFFEFCQLVI